MTSGKRERSRRRKVGTAERQRVRTERGRRKERRRTGGGYCLQTVPVQTGAEDFRQTESPRAPRAALEATDVLRSA